MATSNISKPLSDPLEWVAVHSLGWLLVGNLVGLFMATLLLFPRLGEVLGPLTYGRWVPLHLDLHLYGWCSLPAVGLLLRFYLPSVTTTQATGGLKSRGAVWAEHLSLPSLPSLMARLAITAWSAGLVFGALWWLDGGSSGKLFLEWGGPARLFLAAMLAVLALVLLVGFVRQLACGEAGARLVVLGKSVLLAALLAVPVILYWAAGPEVYPSFNPDSGGSTGGSLLGSTLGLVAIFCLTPLLLGLRRLGGSRIVSGTFLILALHFGWFLLLDHGNRSHHEILEILSLASLLIWIPLLVRYLDSFEWPQASRLWLRSLGFWGVLLVSTGIIGFLPGILEGWKFTNAFVGHAHIAMAGLVTSFNMLVLISLGQRSGSGDRARAAQWTSALSDMRPFKLWHLGLGAQVVALFTLGTIEAFDPGFVIRWHPAAALLYGLRWVGGAVMMMASVQWLTRALATLSETGEGVMSAWVSPEAAPPAAAEIGALTP